MAVPTSTTVPVTARKRASRIPRSPKVIVGGTLLVLFALLAIFGPIVSPHSPNWQASTKLSVPQPPSSRFLLGTDQFQHDIFSQVLAGGRDTLLIAFLAGVVATALSILVGVTAGYVGGLTDELLSILANIFLALPGLLILIVVMRPLPAADTNNPLIIGLVIGLTAWAWGARVLRAQTLALRNQDYVESARVIGERKPRIIVFEVLPNLLPILASSFIFTVIYAIGTYVSLSWLGVINPASNTWGTMLNSAQQSSAMLSNYWWWYVPPALCVALVGIALALLNFGIDEIINPRLRSARNRHRGVRFTLGLTPVLRTEPAAADGQPTAVALANRRPAAGATTTAEPEGVEPESVEPQTSAAKTSAAKGESL